MSKRDPSCPLKPMGPKVVVKLIFDDSDIMSKSTLIHIPEDTKKELVAACTRGVVMAIGPDAFEDWHEDNDLKIGDFVLFKKYSGTNKSFDNVVFRVLEDRDIFAIEMKSEE
jgi:co-chaperonin GroES (HSP10)